MNHFLNALKKYATFDGRASRAEYWYFILFYLIIYVASIISSGMMQSMILPIGIFLFFLLPSLAVTARRLHDINKSGWWMFISIIPFIGNIWLFVLTVTPGTQGPNQFGADPMSAQPTMM